MLQLAFPVFLIAITFAFRIVMCEQPDSNKYIKSFAETFLLKAYISNYISQRSAEAISTHGAFVIALSGGSMPKLLSDLAGRSDVEWEKVYVMFADERCE